VPSEFHSYVQPDVPTKTFAGIKI